MTAVVSPTHSDLRTSIATTCEPWPQTSKQTLAGEPEKDALFGLSLRQSLSTSLPSVHDPNRAFWWQALGPLLAECLDQACYSAEHRRAALKFFHANVAPNLGLGPSNSLRCQKWKSFMTDDYSPVEFSWNWGTGSKSPDVRYSAEMIGPEAGSPTDLFNQKATLQVASNLQDSLPHTDWTWFYAFYEAFRAPEDPSHDPLTPASASDMPHSDHSSPSSVFLAFEHHRSGLTIPKAYFVPSIRSLATLESPLSEVTKALMTLPNHSIDLATSFPAYMHLVDFLNTNPVGKELAVIFLAIDCVPAPQESRLKIYLRSPRTDFASVLEILSMGGTIPELENEDLPHARKLSNLYHSILVDRPRTRSRDGPVGDAAASPGNHETAGMLFYFDCAPSQRLPRPKIYLPAKHYARSDAQACDSLATWLRQDRGDGYAERWCPRFRSLLGAMGVKEEGQIGEAEWRQRSRARAQTYVSVGFEAGGQLNVTSYLGPGVYAKLERMAAEQTA